MERYHLNQDLLAPWELEFSKVPIVKSEHEWVNFNPEGVVKKLKDGLWNFETTEDALNFFQALIIADPPNYKKVADESEIYIYAHELNESPGKISDFIDKEYLVQYSQGTIVAEVIISGSSTLSLAEVQHISKIARDHVLSELNC